MNDKLNKAAAGVLTNFTGVDVPSLNKLRKDCREAGIQFMVVKNTLFKRALKDTKFSALEEHLDGPTSIALAEDDPVILSKTLVDFGKENKNFEVGAGLFKEQVLNADQIKQIAILPSRDVLLAQVASCFQAPYRKLVYTLGGIMSKFVNVLSQIQKKKES